MKELALIMLLLIVGGVSLVRGLIERSDRGLRIAFVASGAVLITIGGGLITWFAYVASGFPAQG